MYFTNCTALDIIICTLPIHSTRYYCLYYYQVSLIFTWESVSPLVTCRSVDSSLQLCSLHCYCLSLQPRPACLGSLLLSGGQVWPAPTSLSGVLTRLAACQLIAGLATALVLLRSADSAPVAWFTSAIPLSAICHFKLLFRPLFARRLL